MSAIQPAEPTWLKIHETTETEQLGDHIVDYSQSSGMAEVQ